MKILRCTIFLYLLGISTVLAQTKALPDSTVRKIDRLFDKWDNATTPGCVVGIVQGDRLIYAKGFGLANLEDSIPNTPASVYYMCSVSKQFAGYAIALLAGEGKLDLDDDIHKYLPWMANFGKKITVRNLLNHTSGIRDDIGLSQYFGLSLDGILTQDMAIRILERQRTLNFIPGEKFSYSNSNYVLLAEIVKVVSNTSFREYTDSNIFRPLGMSSSRFVDDYTELIKERAASYYPRDGAYKNSPQNVYTLGDGGLFTSVNDMAKWVQNFYAPKAGTPADIVRLTTQGKLNSGKTISYAMGIAVDTFAGQKRFIHNGGLAGYRTVVTIFPDLKMGFIVFGNASDREVTGKVDDMASMFIPTPATIHGKANEVVAPVIEIKDDTQLTRWAGTYIALNGYKIDVVFKDGKLFADGKLELAPESAKIYHLVARPAVRYEFGTDPGGKAAILNLHSPVLSQPIIMGQISKVIPSPSEMADYAGTYYSDELDCTFKIFEKDKQLWMSYKRDKDVPITLLGYDHLFTDYEFLHHVLIHRNLKFKITGFELINGDTAGLLFKKQKH